MIRPGNVGEAVAARGAYRAGGTDLHARRRLGLSDGDIVDLRALEELGGVEADAGGARIGALTRIATIAGHPAVVEGWPALSLTAGALATPQIRAVGTLGGNLLQHNRCPYYRHPGFTCYRSGGSSCPAREGDHRHGVIFDLGPCVAPHPSSLAMALMAYDATAVVSGDRRLTMSQLLGDGSDGSRHHRLDEGDVMIAVELPPPLLGERAAYLRATGRALAEWPIVEAVCRLRLAGGSTIERPAIAVGGVAPVPLRLANVEEALAGLDAADLSGQEEAAALSTTEVTPLAMTGHKVPLLRNVVLEAVRRAVEGDAGSESAIGERGL